MDKYALSVYDNTKVVSQHSMSQHISHIKLPQMKTRYKLRIVFTLAFGANCPQLEFETSDTLKSAIKQYLDEYTMTGGTILGSSKTLSGEQFLMS